MMLQWMTVACPFIVKLSHEPCVGLRKRAFAKGRAKGDRFVCKLDKVPTMRGGVLYLPACSGCSEEEVRSVAGIAVIRDGGWMPIDGDLRALCNNKNSPAENVMNIYSAHHNLYVDPSIDRYRPAGTALG